MDYKEVEIKRAALARIAVLSELYLSAEGKERVNIGKAISSLADGKLSSLFYSFVDLKAIDDTLNGVFDVAYSIWKDRMDEQITYIRNGGIDRFTPLSEKELENSVARVIISPRTGDGFDQDRK